jgi:hypothetical protein
MSALKLYMLLLGSKAPGRNVEQHDYYFGIASSVKELVPGIRAFWPEAGKSIHVDGWREVTNVEGYKINIVLKEENRAPSPHKLFFVNLGGYQAHKLEEQHYVVLTVQKDYKQAVKQAKKTLFFKSNTIEGAVSHIDEKYGVDVDDVYRVEDILNDSYKEKYQIDMVPATDLPEDELCLGYFTLNKLP